MRPSRLVLSLLPLLLVACAPKPAEPAGAGHADTEVLESPLDGGAVSTGPVEPAAVPKKPATPVAAATPAVDWSARMLRSGEASISCELDYGAQGDGSVLVDIDRQALTAALKPCSERGVLRLRYAGKIADDFTVLVQRVTTVADALGIEKRVLDIDSAGGQVEDAIKAGDFIAESRWTIWVREGAVCHSACVFVLGAGDTRLISGRVGIHRIIRMSSSATTRAELNAELRTVYERVRGYLERNGVATAVADLMMAVPNRNLRLLTPQELQLYGLDGVNPAQDDLDRLRLMRKCGEDFVLRRDAFVRAFDRRCKAPDTELDVLNTCGLGLRTEFGFPDATCPKESPLSEFDLADLMQGDTPEAAAGAPGVAGGLGAVGVRGLQPPP